MSKLGAIEGNVKHRYKKVLEQTHADNIKVGQDKKLVELAHDASVLIK